MAEAAVAATPAGQAQAPVDQGAATNQEPGSQKETGIGERKGETLQARRARYEALVRGKGEFADLFREDTQRAVQGRLAQAQKAIEAQKPVMDLLMSRYGTQDLARLQQALERDGDWWRSYAQAHGVTEEQARIRLQMDGELEARRRQSARQAGLRNAGAQLRQWAGEARELQKRYPDFDIRAAMADETFQSLLRSRVPMKAAYEVANLERIKESVARQTETKLTATIQANGARPVEGGASGSLGSTVKPDPSRMSEMEILELMERARRGERIIF